LLIDCIQKGYDLRTHDILIDNTNISDRFYFDIVMNPIK